MSLQEEGRETLEQVVTMITADLLKIKRDVEEAHTCLTDNTGTQTLTCLTDNTGTQTLTCLTDDTSTQTHLSH